MSTKIDLDCFYVCSLEYLSRLENWTIDILPNMEFLVTHNYFINHSWKKQTALEKKKVILSHERQRVLNRSLSYSFCKYTRLVTILLFILCIIKFSTHQRLIMCEYDFRDFSYQFIIFIWRLRRAFNILALFFFFFNLRIWINWKKFLASLKFLSAMKLVAFFPGTLKAAVRLLRNQTLIRYSCF